MHSETKEIWQVIGHNSATKTQRVLFECATEKAADLVATEYTRRIREYEGGPLLTGITWVEARKKESSQDGTAGQGRPKNTEE